MSSLQILPNLGTGTELSSNFSETSLTGTELKELKFQQILGGQGTEELGSLTFQRNFPVPVHHGVKQNFTPKNSFALQ